MPEIDCHWRCDECGWRGVTSAILQAPNPFDRNFKVSGCPDCKSVDCFTNTCDEPGCDQIAGCGWPSDAGYRRTCYRHSKFERSAP